MSIFLIFVFLLVCSETAWGMNQTTHPDGEGTATKANDRWRFFNKTLPLTHTNQQIVTKQQTQMLEIIKKNGIEDISELETAIEFVKHTKIHQKLAEQVGPNDIQQAEVNEIIKQAQARNLEYAQFLGKHAVMANILLVLLREVQQRAFEEEIVKSKPKAEQELKAFGEKPLSIQNLSVYDRAILFFQRFHKNVSTYGYYLSEEDKEELVLNRTMELAAKEIQYAGFSEPKELIQNLKDKLGFKEATIAKLKIRMFTAEYFTYPTQYNEKRHEHIGLLRTNTFYIFIVTLALHNIFRHIPLSKIISVPEVTEPLLAVFGNNLGPILLASCMTWNLNRHFIPAYRDQTQTHNAYLQDDQNLQLYSFIFVYATYHCYIKGTGWDLPGYVTNFGWNAVGSISSTEKSS